MLGQFGRISGLKARHNIFNIDRVLDGAFHQIGGDASCILGSLFRGLLLRSN